MKNYKIIGKVVNSNYKDLKIIDTNTGEIVENVKGLTVSFNVGELPKVTVEYHASELEFDIEIEDSKTGEYGEWEFQQEL